MHVMQPHLTHPHERFKKLKPKSYDIMHVVAPKQFESRNLIADHGFQNKTSTRAVVVHE